MRLRAAARVAGIALLALVSHAAAQPRKTPPPFAAKLDAELASIAADPAHVLASLSVLAIRSGEVVYEGHFGHRWIDNADPARNKPANAKTLYKIASISKLVTTLGVMRLVEQGKLDLDRDIGEYLGYAVRNPHFPDAAITLRMMLAHTSSMRDDAGYVWSQQHNLRDFLTPGGRLHGKGEMWSAEARPGTFFNYANLPWGVVGTVMEKATGERFDRLMQRLVIEPLGLSGGYNVADLPPERVADIATLYRKATAGDVQTWDPQGPWVPQVDDYSRAAPVSRANASYVPGDNGTLFAPQSGVRASLADLGRVMRMLMNGGELEGKRILAPATVERMFAREWQYSGEMSGRNSYGAMRERSNSWGLGNQQFLDLSAPGAGDRLVDGGGFAGVGHHGDAYGLTSLFVFDRTTRNGLIFLIGGSAFDPETYRGEYSGFYRHEELIMTAIYRRAIQGKAD